MKKAFVSAKNGAITLSIIRDARPSMQISIDLGISPIFALDLPFPLDEPQSSNSIFSQGIGILVEQIHLFLNDRGFAEDEIISLINSIYNSLESYPLEEKEDSSEIEDGEQLEMHEISLPLSESFLNMVQEQIINNKTASAYVNQAVEFEKRLKERQSQNDQNSRAKNEAAEAINRYKNTLHKSVPGPLYITLYDRFGKPSGVARVTNQGLTKWANGPIDPNQDYCDACDSPFPFGTVHKCDKKQASLADLDELIKVQTSDGNWNYDPYMHGMANGMLLSKGVVEDADKDIEFLEAPKKWLKDATFTKMAYVAHVPGHKNSKGESAPWCIKSHEDGHIISSHKTRAEAKKHLQDMHSHSGSKAALFNRDTFNFGGNEHSNVGHVPTKVSIFSEEDYETPFLESPALKVRAAFDYDLDRGPGTKRDVSFTLQGTYGPNFKIYVEPHDNGDLEGEVWVEFDGEELNRGYPPFKPYAKFTDTPLATGQKFINELKVILDQEYDEMIHEAKAKGDRKLFTALKNEARLKYQELLHDIASRLVPTPGRKYAKRSLLNK